MLEIIIAYKNLTEKKIIIAPTITDLWGGPQLNAKVL